MPGVLLASPSDPVRMLAGRAQCWGSIAWLTGHKCARADILSVGCLDAFAPTLSVWGADFLEEVTALAIIRPGLQLLVSLSQHLLSLAHGKVHQQTVCVSVLGWAVCLLPRDEPDTALPLTTLDCVLMPRHHQSKT